MPRRDVTDKMPFLDHLGELRRRTRGRLVGLLFGIAAGFPVSQRAMDYLAEPIRKTGNSLVYLSLTEAFWVQMKVALILGTFVAAPIILWQVWAFIAPGLYPHE